MFYMSASVPLSIALSVWLILTTVHLPAFSTLQYCPSRHSVANPIHAWPRLASSAAQLPTYCTSALYVQTTNTLGLNKPVKQISVGKRTDPFFFAPQTSSIHGSYPFSTLGSKG
ncbi:hypothetical protein FLAG1_01542 [Fusarium langsethiae]|uniref:Secreted protein n=1 Tax=Fusarium langsethiae TaxID=179993 RepID=A0A0N0DHK0_FUSLA|nr:hypothetical protein FLAG1_01542 [Fusarium langsethiae]